ncbi:hypothetical protein D6779_09460 [Candidatus Parcubacteria bacterium]|nr:MAG: hypothetical protein D6779_09460 [Candidatus Parcubacteria bacterium]
MKHISLPNSDKDPLAFWKRVRMFSPPRESFASGLLAYVEGTIPCGEIGLVLIHENIDFRTKSFVLGYQSEIHKFRLRLEYVAGRDIHEDIMYISYGKIGSPFNTHYRLLPTGTKCLLWLESYLIFGFLAGYSPKDALQVEKEPRREVFRPGSKMPQPEVALHIEAILLRRYGHRIGKLFGSDDQWKHFVEYVKEYEMSNFGRLHRPEPC